MSQDFVPRMRMFVCAGLLTHTVCVENAGNLEHLWSFLLVYSLILVLFVFSGFPFLPNETAKMTFQSINYTSKTPMGPSALG